MCREDWNPLAGVGRLNKLHRNPISGRLHVRRAHLQILGMKRRPRGFGGFPLCRPGELGRQLPTEGFISTCTGGSCILQCVPSSSATGAGGPRAGLGPTPWLSSGTKIHSSPAHPVSILKQKALCSSWYPEVHRGNFCVSYS